jgi:hypothetical protein
VILLLSAILLGFFSHFHKNWPNPNETVRLYLSLAIIEDGRFNIDKEIERYGVIWDRAVCNNKIYSDKAPGISFAAALPLFINKVIHKKILHREPDLKTSYMVAVIFTSFISTLLAIFFLVRLLSLYELSFTSVFLSVLTLIVGTYTNTYSMLFFGHAFSSALIFISFVLIEFYIKKERKPSYIMASAFLASYAFITEYPTIILSLIFLIYLYISTKEKRVFLYSLVALIPVILLLYYQYKCFGKPLSPGYEHLDSEAFSKIHREGLFGFKYPSPEALVNLLFGSRRGLFFFSPALLLAIYMFFRDRFKGQLNRLILVIFVLYTLFISSFGYWIGGDAAGPRHLLPLNLFLILPLAFAIEGIKDERLNMSIFFGLLLISAVNIISSTVSWPFFPPQFLNPIADFGWILIREGFITHSVSEYILKTDGLSSFGIYLMIVATVLFIAIIFTLRDYLRGYIIASEILIIWILFLLMLFPSQPDEQNYKEIIRIERSFDPYVRPPIPFSGYSKNENYICIKRGNMLVKKGEILSAIKEYRCK